MKKFLLILMVATSLIGCVATGDLIRQNVHDGMSSDELVQVIGKPDGYKQGANLVIYFYTNRLIDSLYNTKTDYYFVFENDQLVEYGTGEIRDHRANANALFLIPLVR